MKHSILHIYNLRNSFPYDHSVYIVNFGREPVLFLSVCYHLCLDFIAEISVLFRHCYLGTQLHLCNPQTIPSGKIIFAMMMATMDAAIELETPDSPAHTTPACDPLRCLTSLMHTVMSQPHLHGLALPDDFCHSFVRLDTGDGSTAIPGCDEIEGAIEEGVPNHPLYMHMAAALYKWISTGRFPRNMAPMPGINEDESWKSQMEIWTMAVLTEGSQLLQLWQAVSFQLDVQEPYSSLLKDGHKTVEGRCATSSYKSLQNGDLILVNDNFLLQIKEIRWFPSFQNMLEVEGLSSVLPGIESISEGIKVYRKFYMEVKEKTHGVLGIHVVRSEPQKELTKILSGILNALGIDGMRTLLGMRTTAGTMKEVLPPPKSALLDSFQAPNNPDAKIGGMEVAGSRITVGARALAKHVPRSLDGWWGNISGTELEKNKLAESTLQSLMMNAVWMNVHLAPLSLFEIRVVEGYGARWKADGSQFRGFLEPPMEEGYLKKWRH